MEGRGAIEKVLGHAIHQLRRLRGWTQEELASRAGLSDAAISYYEQGDIVPSSEVMEKIARAASVEVEDIERFAWDVLRFADRVVPSPLPAGQADLAEAMAAELAESFRLRALPLLRDFLAAHRAATPPAAASPAEAQSLWECLELLGVDSLPRLASARPELLGWAVCEMLVEKSTEATSDDADYALKLAEQALWVAGHVEDERERQECETYAWGALGNARRVLSDLSRAEEAINRAFALCPDKVQGGTSLLDRSRLLSFKASLWIDQRKLSEARQLLAEAAAQAMTELSLGRLLMIDAYALELQGDYAGAVSTLERAAALLPEKEKRLRWGAHFNLMANLCHLGRAAEADPMLPALRDLAEQIGFKLDQVRLRWLTARIDAGMGRRRAAIEGFLGVRAQFAEKKIRFDEALVTLELAGVYLEQGRTAEVKRLMLQMAPVFRDQGVHAEAQRALDLFRRAVERERVTAADTRRFVAYLYRAQHDPELRFEAA
jgi:transcriptional regulator with XRE-family HTH domain